MSSSGSCRRAAKARGWRVFDLEEALKTIRYDLSRLLDLERTRLDLNNAPLNPALKSSTETVYETKVSTPGPLETTSAQENEGEGWPVIWLVVTVVCVALAIYFLA